MNWDRSPMDLIRAKQIAGAWGGETDPDKDILKYINIYSVTKYDLTAFVTDTYKLDNINDAIKKLELGQTLRPLIEMK